MNPPAVHLGRSCRAQGQSTHQMPLTPRPPSPRAASTAAKAITTSSLLQLTSCCQQLPLLKRPVFAEYLVLTRHYDMARRTPIRRSSRVASCQGQQNPHHPLQMQPSHHGSFTPSSRLSSVSAAPAASAASCKLSSQVSTTRAPNRTSRTIQTGNERPPAWLAV